MMRILDFIFPPRVDEIIVRDLSVEDFLAPLAPILVDYTQPATTALFPFNNPSVRATLHEAKYHGSQHAFTLLGSALAEYLRDSDDFSPHKTRITLVPVPLGTQRFKERGFNQIEEVIQCALRDMHTAQASLFGIENDLLTRTRETVSQVSLPRHKRKENMRGAFSALHSTDPNCLYIVIDDVITTGATLQAATHALKEAGAKQVLPLALAH